VSGLKPRRSRAFQGRAPRLPGELRDLVRDLAKRRVRILSLYKATDGQHGRMILEVGGGAQAIPAVRKMGFDPIP